MNAEILSTNLRRIRAGKKKSQTEVAAAASMSRVGYRKVETGEVTPRADTLLRIAAALGVGLDDLLREVRPLIHVRFRAKARLVSSAELLADVGRWLDDYRYLEELLGEKRPFAFAAVADEVAAIPRGDARARRAAALVRKRAGIDAGAVIRDICGFLEHHGVKVYATNLASDRFFGLSVAAEDGGPAVVVNCWDRISVERWIFTAAHELGHLLLHRDAFDAAKHDENDDEEQEANLFASQLLMPDELFRKEWEHSRGLGLVGRVFKLKRIFRVSWKTIVYRIAQDAPNKADVWSRFYQEHKRRTGRILRAIDEPEGLPPGEFSAVPAVKPRDEPEHLSSSDFVQDRLCRLVRQAIEAQEITLSRAAEILRIDLGEMRALARSWTV